MRPSKYIAKKKKKHHLHGPIATITNDSQVKTYMDNSGSINGLRGGGGSGIPGGPLAYNKVKQMVGGTVTGVGAGEAAAAAALLLAPGCADEEDTDDEGDDEYWRQQ